jgi:hypothetical protein
MVYAAPHFLALPFVSPLVTASGRPRAATLAARASRRA